MNIEDKQLLEVLEKRISQLEAQVALLQSHTVVNEETERDLTKEQMILLRSIFNSRDYHLLDSSYNRDDALILFRKTLDFMQEAFGYRLKNIKLILD